MASNGLLRRAVHGTCRICQRVRSTDKYLYAIGEVRWGFATGHAWNCKDRTECLNTANAKLANPNVSSVIKARIETALK